MRAKTATSGLRRWWVPPDLGLRWRSWNGDFVVYHGLSGDTHLLNDIAAKALKRLEQGPTTAAELCRHVAATMDLPGEPELQQRIDKLLLRFEDLGLIESTDDPSAPPSRTVR